MLLTFHAHLLDRFCVQVKFLLCCSFCKSILLLPLWSLSLLLPYCYYHSFLLSKLLLWSPLLLVLLFSDLLIFSYYCIFQVSLEIFIFFICIYIFISLLLLQDSVDYHWLSFAFLYLLICFRSFCMSLVLMIIITFIVFIISLINFLIIFLNFFYFSYVNVRFSVFL